LGLVYVPLGKAIAFLLSFLNDGIFAVTDFLQSLRSLQTIWPSPDITWIAAYYTFLALLYLLWKKIKQAKAAKLYLDILHGDSAPSESAAPFDPNQISLTADPIRQLFRLRIFLLFTISGFALLLFIGYTPDRFSRNGLVQFMDVGQGDSILIRTPEGKHILIDGGGTLSFHKPGEDWKIRRDPYEVGRKLLVPLLKKRGVHQLDTLILTHQDADHSGGLQAVLEQIPVKQCLFNGTLKPNEGVKKLFRTALKRNIPLIAADPSHIMSMDAGTQIQFLYPFLAENNQIRVEAQQNNQSLVFLLQMEATRWLFTGDMEMSAEALLLKAWKGETERPPSVANVSIDVLKVAHYGSKTSSTEEWLKYWNPRYAVISVGVINSYGHPSLEVIERLREHQIGVFRTDQMGEVQIGVRKGSLFQRIKLQ
jgi:competence protein ComEC